MAISLFLHEKYAEQTITEDMINGNGDIILNNIVSAVVEQKRNEIWYLTIEFPESELLGYKLTNECVFKVDLNYIKGQLFRTLYHKYNKTKRTYTCYANHVFFDAQKEVFVFDDRTVNGDWNSAIKTANDIITNSEATQPYKVYGEGWYDDYTNLTLDDLYDGIEVTFKCDYNSKVIDLADAGESSGNKVQIYEHNGTLAQQWCLMDQGTYNGYRYWGLMSKTSCRYIDVAAAKSTGLTQGAFVLSEGLPANGKVRFDAYVVDDELKGFLIRASTNDTMCFDSNSTSTSPSNSTQMTWYPHTNYQDYSAWRLFKIQDVNATATAYWVEMNLIQCLFGTEDNSLINRWCEADDHHYVAMFDNFDCYFGRMDKYKDELKPKEWIITDREVSDYSKKVSMENVVTGIIPKGYNDKGLPDKEIVKSDKWDEYEIHRIEQKTYSDVEMQSDASETNANKYYTNEENFQYRLRYEAKRDMANNSHLQEPTTETKTEMINILVKQYGSEIKLNDTIYYQSGRTRDKYYIDSIKYDALTKEITDIDLVLESESNN